MSKHWTISNKCMDCGAEITYDQTRQSTIKSPMNVFGKANLYGVVPDYMKEATCACGTDYYVGFFKHPGKGYQVGLLVKKNVSDAIHEETKKIDTIKKQPQAHSPRPSPLDGYTSEERDMKVPMEIDVCDRGQLIAMAIECGTPSVVAATASNDVLKKIVTVEQERVNRVRAQRDAAQLARLQRKREEELLPGETVPDEPAEPEPEPDETDAPAPMKKTPPRRRAPSRKKA